MVFSYRCTECKLYFSIGWHHYGAGMKYISSTPTPNGEPIVVSLNWTRGSLLEPGPGTASFLSSKLNFNRINYLMSILDNSGQLNPIKIR